MTNFLLSVPSKQISINAIAYIEIELSLYNKVNSFLCYKVIFAMLT